MIDSFIHSISDLGLDKKQPWKSIANLSTLIEKLLQNLGADYAVIGADIRCANQLDKLEFPVEIQIKVENIFSLFNKSL